MNNISKTHINGMPRAASPTKFVRNLTFVTASKRLKFAIYYQKNMRITTCGRLIIAPTGKAATFNNCLGKSIVNLLIEIPEALQGF